ncbi:hypothetical protein P3342_011371 [Pyrenophora teres f. teres]|nr:hypothetical protein P3342_011371 [Pyrenophora teres f. teres]
MAEKEAKKNGGKTTNGASKSLDPKPAVSNNASSQPAAAPAKPSASAPLIDLFEALEDNQQTMATQPMMQQQYPQQTGFQQGFQMPQQTATIGFPQQSQPFPMQNGQNTNPFQMQQQSQAPQIPAPQLQTQFTGAGFGGYTPQPFNPQGPMPSIPQNGMPDFSQQQQHMQIPTIAEPLQPQQTSTNPFRQSMLPNTTGMGDTKMLTSPTGASSINRTSTNPFAKQNTGFLSSRSPLSTHRHFQCHPSRNPPSRQCNNSHCNPHLQAQTHLHVNRRHRVQHHRRVVLLCTQQVVPILSDRALLSINKLARVGRIQAAKGQWEA